MSKKTSLLINTKDMLFLLTPLAVLIGDREAIALQQVHYWLDRNEEDEKFDTHFYDGKWWTYNTWNDWRVKNFPFWSLATVQRVFESLVNKGLVILRDHENRNKGKWVTICYEALDTFKRVEEPRKKRESKRVRSSQTDETSDGDRSSQTDETGLVKLTRLSSQTDETTGNTETTETTTETNISADAVVTSKSRRQRKAKAPKEPKPKTPKAKDVVFDAVALYAYGIHDTTHIDNGSVIGSIRAMAIQKFKAIIGEPQADVVADSIRQFAANQGGKIPKFASVFQVSYVIWLQKNIDTYRNRLNGQSTVSPPASDAPLPPEQVASPEEIAKARAIMNGLLEKTDANYDRQRAAKQREREHAHGTT